MTVCMECKEKGCGIKKGRYINVFYLLTAFFTANMSDEERWEVIEQYFLGNGDYVRQVLHMSD